MNTNQNTWANWATTVGSPSPYNPKSSVGSAWRTAGTYAPGQGEAMQKHFADIAAEQNRATNLQQGVAYAAELMKGQLGAAGIESIPFPFGGSTSDYQNYMVQGKAALQQQAEQRAEQQQRANYEAAWPSYQEAMRQYELDPLQQLYTGRKYGETPLTREEYDYLRLRDRFEGAGQQYLQPWEKSDQPYMPGSKEYYNSWQYYQTIQNRLKEQEALRKSQEQNVREQARQVMSNFPTPGGQQFVHFMTPEMRRVMGVSDADVAQSKRAYDQYRAQSGAWDRRREQLKAQNRQFEQQNLQSAAARGFYNTPGQGVQTPYAYQTWGGA